MPEGSPPGPTPPTEPEVTPPADVQPDEPKVLTAEETEAIWKNRVSGKDKAHAEEVRVLRENLTAAEARATAKVASDLANASEADQWKARAEAAEKAAVEERQARVMDVRSAKYPAAAEALEPGVIATMDEGKLAALNTRLSGDETPPPSPIDPNAAPKRTPSPPTPAGDKSVADLESDLKKYGPEYAQRLADT